MSGHAVWIDENNMEARSERLRLAYVKVQQRRLEAAHSQYRREDKQRGYPVYEHGRKYRNGPKDRNPVDSLLLIGALAIVAMLMGTAGL